MEDNQSNVLNIMDWLSDDELLERLESAADSSMDPHDPVAIALGEEFLRRLQEMPEPPDIELFRNYMMSVYQRQARRRFLFRLVSFAGFCAVFAFQLIRTVKKAALPPPDSRH